MINGPPVDDGETAAHCVSEGSDGLPAVHHTMTTDRHGSDGSGPARGILLALVLSFVLWIVIALIVKALT